MLLMEGFYLAEHVELGTSPEIAQEAKKKRSPEQKYGRQRWNQTLLKRVYNQNERILDELRWVRRRLQAEGYNDYTVPMIQKFAVVDQVDLEILDIVFRVGSPGIYPSKIAKDLDAIAEQNKLKPYGLSRFNVSDRIMRMNKRLHFETGELLFEKRGQKWALTAFAFEVWGETEKEVM
jgi:hypothetical protein